RRRELHRCHGMSRRSAAALPGVSERADQMLLNYVSKAADAAHGVLSPEQRVDFARRLRARIEEERRAGDGAGDVARLLARFGDPVLLVEREARRLAQAAPVPAGTGASGEEATAAHPRIRDDVPEDRRELGMPFAGLRRAAMSVANPMVTEGSDARIAVKRHPREAAALVVLAVAALLVPF